MCGGGERGEREGGKEGRSREPAEAVRDSRQTPPQPTSQEFESGNKKANVVRLLWVPEGCRPPTHCEIRPLVCGR